MNPAVSSLRILPVETEIRPLRPDTEPSVFEENLRAAMDGVEEVSSRAQQKVSQLLRGDGADVHSAMIAVEQAELSFELMMQVRNKIVEAYQEIARMQF
jgi:flagellar hook-basal body complex protein FliE